METVWIVESGEYSDYNVDGIFSTKENAELFRGAYGGEVVERTLDPYVKEIRSGMVLFHVKMNVSGAMIDCYKSDCFYGAGELGLSLYHDGWCLVGYIWAKDKQHAAKIANERRVQLIALNQWPKG